MVPWIVLVVEVAFALAIVAGLLALVTRPPASATPPSAPVQPDVAAAPAGDGPRAAA